MSSKQGQEFEFILAIIKIYSTIFLFFVNEVQDDCKTRENSNFRKKGKIIISVEIQNFSISRMKKWISSLESSHEI